MRTFRDGKVMAKALRQALSDRKIDLSHSECLELVARQFGVPDWNTLSARINASSSASLRVPQGWLAAGSKPALYEMGVDPTRPRSPAIIRCKYTEDDQAYLRMEKGFGTLMQSILADTFRGKTVRLFAELRAQDLDGAGTIWMRIESSPGKVLRFDNLEDRAHDGVLRGTSEWTGREIVLDVPNEAMSIHYGFYLRGTGALSARNFSLTEVEAEAVARSRRRMYLDKPSNLDFSGIADEGAST